MLGVNGVKGVVNLSRWCPGRARTPAGYEEGTGALSEQPPEIIYDRMKCWNDPDPEPETWSPSVPARGCDKPNEG